MEKPLSRRGFLGGAIATGVAALGAAAEHKIQKIVPRVERSAGEPRDVVEFSEPHPADTPWEREESLPPLEQTEARALQEFRSELARFQRLLDGRLSETEDDGIDSLQAQSAARDFLLRSSLPERLLRVAPLITRSSSAHGQEYRMLFDQTLQVFHTCDCQGLVYAAIRDAVGDAHGTTNFQRDSWYYGAHLRDYVPGKKDLWSQDVDPRNKPNEPEDARRKMRADPAWAGKRRKELFRTLATRPSLVERAQRDDLTMVEFFSLIKSIVHERAPLTEEQRAVESIEGTAERLLALRRELLHRKVLSPETQKAIIFYGDDRRYMLGSADTTWDGSLDAAGVRPERVERIATSDTRTNADALRDLQRAIASSRGKTFLSFKTHGAVSGLYIDSQRGTEHISDAFIAEALIARIQATRDPSTLKDMDIVVDACHSYEFRNNVILRMKELWERGPMRAHPFERVAKPFFVTVVQEGSVGQAGSLICGVLDADSQVRAVRQEDGLSVERLLKKVQPRVYEESDMTFFAPGSGTEFAGRASSPSRSRAA